MHSRAKPTVRANMKGKKLSKLAITRLETLARAGLTECSWCTGHHSASDGSSVQKIGRNTVAVLQCYKPVSSC